MSTLTEKEQKEVTTTMIFTCDACNYTFSADTLPTSCPDCGKSSVDHRKISPEDIPSELTPIL